MTTLPANSLRDSKDSARNPRGRTLERGAAGPSTVAYVRLNFIDLVLVPTAQAGRDGRAGPPKGRAPDSGGMAYSSVAFARKRGELKFHTHRAGARIA